MLIKGITMENFTDYKKPSMYIAFPKCNFKCDTDCGRAVCQNSSLAKEKNIEINNLVIAYKYRTNLITKAIVFGGLEPFDSFSDMINLIKILRQVTQDDIVIYTGYTEEEIGESINFLKIYPNIIVKFGRFIPDQENHYDETLGVNLASPNQYAKKIS